MNIKRMKNTLLLRLAASWPTLGAHGRARLAKLGGVNIPSPKHTHIGEGVIFDTLHPELITIKPGALVTMRCIILTHYTTPNKPGACFTTGQVVIGEHAFIGAGTIICNSVTIGIGAFVAAGSVVTKDIPADEVWGGVPAHFIRKRGCY